MKKMYKFFWDCGRMGKVESVFIAEENDVKNIIGKEVYFGDILGKYSEVCGIIEVGDVIEIKVSPITVEEMEKIIGSTISGYNPLAYM